MKVKKLTSRIGAEVSGINVSRPLDAATISAITDAFHEHSVLFFTGQRILSAEEQLRFARRFGKIEVDDFQTHASAVPEVMILDQTQPKGQGADRWHADSTYHHLPPMGIMLQAHRLPDSGGDTCFAGMYAAYDLLSPPIQQMLDGLTAVHSTSPLIERTRGSGLYKIPENLAQRPPVSHPVIAIHPRTGRRMLNVNSQWTTRIEGLTTAESDALLGFLFEHVKSPEIQLRFRWREGDIAFLDNRSVQHYAVADYDTRRVMQRIVLAGEPEELRKGPPKTRRRRGLQKI
jgi:taurine dioxygenase